MTSGSDREVKLPFWAWLLLFLAAFNTGGISKSSAKDALREVMVEVCMPKDEVKP